MKWEWRKIPGNHRAYAVEIVVQKLWCALAVIAFGLSRYCSVRITFLCCFCFFSSMAQTIIIEMHFIIPNNTTLAGVIFYITLQLRVCEFLPLWIFLVLNFSFLFRSIGVVKNSVLIFNSFVFSRVSRSYMLDVCKMILNSLFFFSRWHQEVKAIFFASKLVILRGSQ